MILRNSITIEKRVEERSIASFTVIDETGTEIYVRGMPVEIYDHVGALVFSGFIDTPGCSKHWVGAGLLHDIVCMDNHYLADKRLVVKPYTEQTAGFIVNDILTDYLAVEGVTVGEIQAGPIITEAIFNYVKVSECMDALQELTGFTWFIDEFKRLYFIDRSTNLAPWNLDGVIHRAIKDSVHLSTGNPYYRNIQYIKGGMGLTTQQTETFTGDGTTKAFTVGYLIAKVPTVTVQDRIPEGQTVGIKGLDSGQDCYWNKGDTTITFEVAPESAKTVTIVYYGQFPLITKAVSTDIDNRASIEGTSGKVEVMTIETQHESGDSSSQSAQGKINQYCQDAEKFTYQTYEAGLSPGQLQQITYAPFGFTNHEMLIESIVITTSGEDIRYDVTCITGPSMGSWARFFANILKRQDASINLGDSLLSVLLEQPETLALTEVGSESHHETENYLWEPTDLDDTRWSYFTWG